jgi:sporulation protein YlmC with PRC-barrel domain/CBS domain-containing protein
LDPSGLENHCLSYLLVRRVYSESGQRLGKVSDFILDLEKSIPEVVGLVYRRGYSSRRFCLPWSDVVDLANYLIVVRKEFGPPVPIEERVMVSSEVLLRDFLLDKQIVDVHGAKVERVNDLNFIRSEGKLLLVQVDVGLKGLLRRLGFEDSVTRFSKWFFDYDLKDRFIAWNYVEPLAYPDRLKLQVPQDRLAELHPADLADIIEDMDVHERSALAETLDEEVLAEAIEEMDPKIQVSIMRQLEPDRAADIMEEMSPDEAADLIADLPQETATGILREMDAEYEEKLKGLLAHEEDEAGGLMTTQFMAFPPDKTIVEALAHVRRHANEMDVVYYLYIVDNQGKLLGVTNLKELLSNEIFTPLEQIMTTRVITAKLDDGPQNLADLFGKYGFRGIPVVDEENRIAGVVRFKALLEILAPHLGK